MHYLGIDWGADKHDLCLLNEEGTVLSEFSINHSHVGFAALQDLLSEFGPVQVNIERSDGLLVDWLCSQQCLMHLTPPSVLASKRPRRSKDDRGDAHLLAHLLRVHDPEVRPLAQQSPTVVELRHLISAYDDLVSTQRRLGNRLNWVLRQYYPNLLKAFSRPYNLIGLKFLETFPRPQDAKALSIDELDSFLQAQNYSPRKRRLVGIHRALQEPMPYATVDAGLVEMGQLLIPRLRCIYQQKAHLQQRIVAVFKTHPEASWWRTFPGAKGPLTPARLLAAIGDDRRRFPSREILQATAGTAPVTRRSGKQVRVEFRQACSKSLRKAVDHFTRQSVKRSGWAKAYYHQQLLQGHSKSRAHRALGNRWLSVIWKLWQTGEIYDEAIHTANRSQQRQRLAA